jgi:hypothetical protein
LIDEHIVKDCHILKLNILGCDNDAHAHIDELQQQPIPPTVLVVPEGGEEDPRKSREFLISIPNMEIQNPTLS